MVSLGVPKTFDPSKGDFSGCVLSDKGGGKRGGRKAGSVAGGRISFFVPFWDPESGLNNVTRGSLFPGVMLVGRVIDTGFPVMGIRGAD